MMRREDAVVEERSQCSSEFQSGWTLYLEHSGSGHQQCYSLPYYHPDASDEEASADSMVSDASSGPAPQHLLSEGEELQVEGSRDMLRCSFHDHFYYSRRSGRRSSGSSASRSFGSTRTGSLGDVKSGTKIRATVVQVKEEAMHQRRHGAILVDDDDLHDTASSSSAIATTNMLKATYTGAGGDVMNLHPIGAFLAKHALFSEIGSGYQHEQARLYDATP